MSWKYWFRRRVEAFWWFVYSIRFKIEEKLNPPEPVKEDPVDPLVQRYADYMTIEARKWEDNNASRGMTYKQHIEKEDRQKSLFVGVIPHDWESRVDTKHLMKTTIGKIDEPKSDTE